MIRIGVINIDVSHPKAFAEYLLTTNRARYTAVYNDGFREDDEVEAFIRNFGLEKRCSSVNELADFVDIGFIQGCNWDKHLEYAQPFFERGKPVFIDKPLIGSEIDCIRLDQMVRDGAVVLGSSSVRYAKEITDFMSIDIDERGEILNVFGTAGVDEFNYGIHIIEAIGGILGAGAVSCKFVGDSIYNDKKCDTFYIKFHRGATAVYNLFSGIWQPFEIIIMTTKTTYRFRIDTGRIYKELLDRICEFMETGKSSLARTDQLIESVRIMLAGKISKENDGSEVLLADIPKDYSGYDGYLFENEYAKKAVKIYL